MAIPFLPEEDEAEDQQLQRLLDLLSETIEVLRQVLEHQQHLRSASECKCRFDTFHLRSDLGYSDCLPGLVFLFSLIFVCIAHFALSSVW